MAKNYQQEGESLTLTTPGGGVVSGTAYLIGGLVVIAQGTYAATVKGEYLVCGVVTHAKVAAQAWAEGVKIYWDNGAKLFTTVAGGNTLVGVAAAAALNPSSTGQIRLDGVTR